jgi:hypothetical protein
MRWLRRPSESQPKSRARNRFFSIHRCRGLEASPSTEATLNLTRLLGMVQIT